MAEAIVGPAVLKVIRGLYFKPNGQPEPLFDVILRNINTLLERLGGISWAFLPLPSKTSAQLDALAPKTAALALKSDGVTASCYDPSAEEWFDLARTDEIWSGATDAEARAMTATDKIVTPSNLAARGCFAVTLSSNQTGIAAATATKVTFNTEAFDVGSWFDTTNNRWTPPAGKVRLSARLALLGVTATQNCAIMIYKNGAELRRSLSVSVTVGGFGVAYPAITEIVEADGDDYFEIWVDAPSGGTITVVATSTSAVSAFSGEQV